MAGNQEVIIVGGGVIGCSIGFHLTKAKLKVLILERGQLGAGASNAASGTLATTDDRNSYAKLERASFRMFPDVVAELRDISGVDAELVECGGLDLLLTEEEVISAQESNIHFGQSTKNVQKLNPKEVHELEPELSTNLYGAIYRPKTSRVNNQRLTEGFAKSAKRLGARIQLGANVLGINVVANKVTGVKLQSGDIHADIVIVAGGAWSDEILAHNEINVPVWPVRGQNLNLQPDFNGVKSVISESTGVIVPRNDGSVMAGVTIENVGFDNKVTTAGIRTIMNKVTSIVPSLENSVLNWTVSGLRPGTEDDFPIMGPISGTDGLIIAAGHYRSGILLSPITGVLITNLVTQGDIGLLRPFGLDRFRK